MLTRLSVQTHEHLIQDRCYCMLLTHITSSHHVCRLYYGVVVLTYLYGGPSVVVVQKVHGYTYLFSRYTMKMPLLCFLWLLVLQTAHGLTATTPADESSPNLARWKDRWDTNTLGWHKDDVNDILKVHGDKLLMQPQQSNDESSCSDVVVGVRVFVPLCGKSVDVAYLAKHAGVSEVLGLDGIMKALENFSAEHPYLQLKQMESTGGPFEVLKGNNITLLKGDFFDLTTAEAGKFSAIYDRAAMVAIQPQLRENYIAILRQLLGPGGKILLSTVEHEMGTGPPFSVLASDLEMLYGSQEWVKSITQLNPDETAVDEKGRLNRWYIIQAV